MKFLLICVNYNSYQHLQHYARSLAQAHRNSTNVFFRFVVVDNSSVNPDKIVLDEIKSLIDDFVYIKSNNIGYFPAAAFAFDSIVSDVDMFDYIAVTNVDLEVTYDFFNTISGYVLKHNDGVLAPALISRYRRSDLNPKILIRPNRQKMKRNLTIFSSLLLFWLYGKFSNLKYQFFGSRVSSADVIYAPHGSCMIFTKNFFNSGGNLNYPCFLFGEEIFVGEECAARNLIVRYLPEIVVYDLDHGSTSLQSIKFISSEHSKSLRYLLDKYFLKCNF